MKNVLIALAIIVIAIIVYFGYRSYYPKSSNTNSGSSSAAVATNSVEIKNMAFSPANISVDTGHTVTFTNNDSVTHTVTADDGSFDSSSIAPGKTFSKTFATAGTFTYHCSIHPSMTGTIEVK